MTRAKITEDLSLMSLAQAVSIETGSTPAEAQAYIQATVDVIGRALAAGHAVKISNAFTLSPGTRRLGAGALGGRVKRARTVKVVKFHLNGRLLEAVRSGRKVTTLKKTGKTV